MIYLDNKTLLQELYIPRQEYISVTTGSGGTYAEGYADGVNDQKAKLASTAFTENGDYQRNDGWSAITVNVPQSGSSVLEGKEIVVSQDVTIVVPTSGYDGFSAVTVDATEYGQTNYDSGFDDGYTDGYSSGSSEGYDSGYTDGYQSGSTDGYESGYTSGSTDGYESGYTEGYNSGYTSGETDGYNSGYTSGETDGFNSGYTSGETHQKSLLVSTAITQNGSYQRENGYSAITVNVPIPNIEANKEFTATTNGDYTIIPSTASTIVNAHLNTWNQYIISIDFNGYPSGYFNVLTIKSDDDNKYINVYYNGNMPYHNSIGWIGDPVSYEYKSSTQLTLHINNANANYGWEKNSGFLDPYDAMSAVSLTVNVDTATTYSSGYTDGENHIISTFTATTATTNGVYGSSANPLSSITVNVPTGSTATLGVGSFSANGTYSASTDNLDGYSAITINVPQSGSTEKDIVICTSGGCWFTTNYQIDYGDSIEIEHCTFGIPILPYPGTHQQYVGGNSSEVFRIGQNEYGLYLKYFSNFNSGGHIIYFPSSGSILEDNTITFSSTGFTVDGNVVTSYTTTEISSIATLIFFANNSSGGDVVEKQTAKMGRVKVYASDGTLKATFEPRLDNLNVPYFKYVEQDIDIYASGSGTPLYEILDPMYNSGYTDGYTSGYTDGSASIASFIDRSITEVVIPSGCTKIGSYAFTYCYSLSSVTIPNTVTEIGNNAFMRNIFSAITIPSGVTKIGDYAFQYCSSLSSVTIPNSVTSIGSNAFASCYSLSSVTIPNSVTKIENYVFQYCSKLQSVTIPNSVTSIGSSSFDGCSVLIEANIGSGVTIINQRAFRNCSALTDIYISATTAPTISNANAFQGVPSTGTVHYPQGSDYSSWQSNTYLSGWTFSADL